MLSSPNNTAGDFLLAASAAGRRETMIYSPHCTLTIAREKEHRVEEKTYGLRGFCYRVSTYPDRIRCKH